MHFLPRISIAAPIPTVMAAGAPTPDEHEKNMRADHGVFSRLVVAA
jgi:hypothetical protein